MKAFAVLAVCVATVAAQYGPSQIRVQSSSSYGAPQVSSSYSGGGSYGGNYGGSSYMKQQIPIVRFNQDISGSNSNNVQYETGNGISVSDNTHVVGGYGYGSEAVVKKQGQYSYTSPEGQHISTGWSADEGGFRAQGAHLPRPVEMPAEHAQAHREALNRASGSSYGSGSYEAPTSYTSYAAPASYSAPAPMRSSYEAPSNIRVQSYDAPMRSSGY